MRLQGLNHPLTAGVSTTVTCASSGARPPPQIIWHKGGVEVRGTQSVSFIFILFYNTLVLPYF